MVRVPIERKVAAGMETAYQKLTREVRQTALQIPGYISGETLRDFSNPHHYVTISTWRSRRECNAWLTSSERVATGSRMAPMLLEEERLIILEPL